MTAQVQGMLDQALSAIKSKEFYAPSQMPSYLDANV